MSDRDVTGDCVSVTPDQMNEFRSEKTSALNKVKKINLGWICDQCGCWCQCLRCVDSGNDITPECGCGTGRSPNAHLMQPSSTFRVGRIILTASEELARGRQCGFLMLM